jgi:hypothetical protein
MNHRHICTAGMISHHDLVTTYQALEAGPASMNMRLVLIRHLIMAIANVAALAAISSALYKDHRDLGELHRPVRRALEFFKYAVPGR